MEAADHCALRTAQTAQQVDVGLWIDEKLLLRAVCDVAAFVHREHLPAIVVRRAFEEPATFAREVCAGGGDDGLPMRARQVNGPGQRQAPHPVVGHTGPLRHALLRAALPPATGGRNTSSGAPRIMAS